MFERCRMTVAVVAALVLSAGFAATTAGAGVERTAFTGTEVYSALVAPGVEWFPDGRYQGRGEVDRFAFEASDPRLDDGVNTVIVNWSFAFAPEPVFVTGRMWGTFRLENAGGWWEGTWNGVRDETGRSSFRFVGQGGGGYDGLQLRMLGIRVSPDPSMPETYEGIVLGAGG